MKEAWDRACRDLALADPVLGALFPRFPGEILGGSGDAFQTLANAIVGQQISVKAGASIWARLEAHTGAVRPGAILASDDAALRACGLSGRKVEYLRGIAEAFSDGRIDPKRWPAMDDEAVITELTGLRGIGRWTAEMYLIFHLGRLDILPLDDIAFLRGCARLYAWDDLTDAGRSVLARRVAQHAERWRPWRTVAVWYIWRTLDPEPVVY